MINPFAKIFRDGLTKDVLDQSLILDYNNIDNAPLRVKKFILSLNKLFKSALLPPVCITNYQIDETKLINYAQLLRGYMRDAQPLFPTLTIKQVCDENIIDVFHAAGQYVAACNNKVKGYKHIVNNDAPYIFWKIDVKKGLDNADFEITKKEISPNNKNLLLFMPFRIKSEENELKNWLKKYWHNSLDSDVFKKNIDIYTIHFPINKSRGSKVHSNLKTIENPNSYIEDLDIDLIKQHFLPVLGKNIKLNDKNQIIAGSPHSNDEFIANCKNLTLVGYCAGTADAHRYVMGIQEFARQLYNTDVVKEAMKNIFIVSYSFLPPQKHNPYSGAHFITNNREFYEPFSKLNAPELYEQVRYESQSSLPARVSLMPDRQNYIISQPQPEKLVIFDKGIKVINDKEYGHDISHVTGTRLGDNFSQQQFCTVLENAAQGKRGNDVFTNRNPINYNNQLMSYATLANKNYVI